MANLILTKPRLGGGSTGGLANAFETIVTDVGSVTASGADTLVLTGGLAVSTTVVAGSPNEIRLDVNPNEITLENLGNVFVGSPIADGYTLVYRTGSPSGWVAEPSTTTDEFVKASGTDTVTGHLSDKLVAGSNITLTTLNSGGNEQIQIDATSGPSDLLMSVINGQPMLTYLDTTRGSPGKRLSVAEQTLIFSENRLSSNDWIEIGNAVDADSGFVVDFDGTVVFATGHCENTGANSKNIHLFINGIDQGSIGTLTGGTNVSFINTTMDIDFVQGDKIRLQAQQGTGGNIQDTVVKLTVKWRT